MTKDDTQDKQPVRLSEAEEVALRKVRSGLLVSSIPDATVKSMGFVDAPGMRVYRGLIKKGLIFETEEDPITFDDGVEFQFTPSMEMTEEGEALYAELFGSTAFRM